MHHSLMQQCLLTCRDNALPDEVPEKTGLTPASCRDAIIDSSDPAALEFIQPYLDSKLVPPTLLPLGGTADQWP